MKNDEKFIGFSAPRHVAEALARRRRETGQTIKSIVCRAVMRYLRIRPQGGNGGEACTC